MKMKRIELFKTFLKNMFLKVFLYVFIRRILLVKTFIQVAFFAIFRKKFLR